MDLKKQIILLVFLCFSFCEPIFALVVLPKENYGSHQLNWNDYQLALINTESFSEVLSQDSIFTILDEFPSFDKYSFPYWWKIEFENLKGQDLKYVFEFQVFRLDELEIYIPNNTGKYKKVLTGDIFDFDQREYQHKNFVFSLPNQEHFSIYFRVKKHDRSDFGISTVVYEEKGFSRYSLNEYAFLSFFYGMLICMGLYNLFLYFYLKEQLHLYYFLYTLSLSLFCLSRLDGLGFQYLWFAMPWVNSFAFSVSEYLFVVSSLLFATAFLDLKKKQKRWWLITKVIIVVRTIELILGLSSFDFFLDKGFVDWLIMGMPVVIGIANKNQSGLFYKGYLAMFIGLTSYVVGRFNVLPGGLPIPVYFHFFYLINYAVLVATVYFSLAISERAKRMRQEVLLALKQRDKVQETLIEELHGKEALRDKVNKELESRVTDRTVQLQLKTEESVKLSKLLEEQKEQIEAYAKQLDVKNFKLNRALKEEKKAMFGNTVFTYDKFFENLADDDACVTYVRKIKWNDYDKCVKCGGESLKLRKDKSARKCGRCNNIESVTSGTIFHRLRFSMHKAFFLAYITLNHEDVYTYTALATMLDMRINTCSSFCKKVKEVIDRHNLKSGELDRLILLK